MTHSPQPCVQLGSNTASLGAVVFRTALRFAENAGHDEVSCILRVDPSVSTIQESAAAGRVHEVWALMRQVRKELPSTAIAATFTAAAAPAVLVVATADVDAVDPSAPVVAVLLFLPPFRHFSLKNTPPVSPSPTLDKQGVSGNEARITSMGRLFESSRVSDLPDIRVRANQYRSALEPEDYVLTPLAAAAIFSRNLVIEALLADPSVKVCCKEWLTRRLVHSLCRGIP